MSKEKTYTVKLSFDEISTIISGLAQCRTTAQEKQKDPREEADHEGWQRLEKSNTDLINKLQALGCNLGY